MGHNFLSIPAFIDNKPDDPISEFALRVIVERPNWQLDVVGTATLVLGHLAITARHVLEHVVREFGAVRKDDKNCEITNCELKLYQVLPTRVYRIWRVCTAWITSSDIAVLHLGLDRTTAPNEQIVWKQPILRAFPPPVGQTVAAFGYREGTISVQEADGVHHIALNDRPTTSAGIVRNVYPNGRDRVMLPFPCFEIEARFEPGMSGGMVLDENGALCGLVCASLQQIDNDAPPISYVASLAPIFGTTICANRGSRYPRDISYPMIDLALDGLIAVRDLAELKRSQLGGG